MQYRNMQFAQNGINTMNIKISAFCRKERLSKNQTAKVYLRFTKNRKSRYVSTGISVPISEWDFDTQTSTNQLVQIKIYEQIASYQKRIQRLEVLDIEPTLDKIIDKSQCCANSLLADFFKQVISYLESVDKFGTASKYKATLSLLHNFGMDNVRFDDIDIKYLQDFETALHLKGNQPNSIATKISVLKAVYNRALKEKIFICQENPFVIYKAAFRYDYLEDTDGNIYSTKHILSEDGIYEFEMRFKYGTVYRFTIDTKFINNALVKARLKRIDDL